MAEEKKDKKDKKPEPVKSTPEEEMVYVLGGLFIIAIILGQITYFVSSTRWGNVTNVWNYFLHSYFWPLWNNWKYIAVLLSAGGVVWLIHSFKKLREIDKEEEKIYGTHRIEHPVFEGLKEEVMKERNDKWERVLEHAHSDNPSDWRLAIMEADVLLEETLRQHGFPGDTVGDMLKSAGPGDMVNLDAAWEAHKVRNRIAHSGGDYELNERETRRIVSLFESIFREFKVI